jgi:hypothetical protein
LATIISAAVVEGLKIAGERPSGTRRPQITGKGLIVDADELGMKRHILKLMSFYGFVGSVERKCKDGKFFCELIVSGGSEENFQRLSREISHKYPGASLRTFDADKAVVEDKLLLKRTQVGHRSEHNSSGGSDREFSSAKDIETTFGATASDVVSAVPESVLSWLSGTGYKSYASVVRDVLKHHPGIGATEERKRIFYFTDEAAERKICQISRDAINWDELEQAVGRRIYQVRLVVGGDFIDCPSPCDIRDGDTVYVEL